jgi:hypothetical protein
VSRGNDLIAFYQVEAFHANRHPVWGGDAPGLNAVIRAVVKTAVIKYGWEVMGIFDGFKA